MDNRDEQLVIEGGRPLEGTIPISGAKNAALPIMAAALLCDGTTTLRHVPDLTDVHTLTGVLEDVGMRTDWTGPHTLELEVTDDEDCHPAYRFVREMRASVCVLGPLTARRGHAEVPHPGGCDIGSRPLNLHKKGLRKLGAEVRTEKGVIYVNAPHLEGRRMDLSGPFGSTVLGTANVMMAATLADGTTVIEQAACEPEIQDLARFLNECGAAISGIGTRELTIEGVDELQGTTYSIISDRIEAATYAAAAIATGGSVTLDGAPCEHMSSTIEKLRSTGAKVHTNGRKMEVDAPEQPEPVSFSTRPYPGLPTDVHPQMAAVLSLADGRSTITEKVHPDRFTHVDELNRLGADISRDEESATIRGVEQLSGAHVTAADLRAGAGLIIACLAADGTSTVDGLDQVDRGYEDLVDKLTAAGASIRREPI
ncbi:MAG: UDP-N-acetylglucosamine 1-carboxyvinyltransferase [Planctomycetota bacterium]